MATVADDETETETETESRKMNQIANRASTAVAALSSLKAGLQNVSSTLHTPGGVPILRLLKDGTWVFGAENVEVEAGALWAANPFSLQHGWVAWTDKPGNAPNEIVGEIMVPATTPLPLESSLPDVGEQGGKWKQQISVELQCLNGEDKGETVVYKVTSVGGLNACKSLITALTSHLDEDPSTPVPVVSLEHDTYMHKRHGKVYVPLLAVVKWVELTDNAPAVEEPEETPVEEKAPARSRRAAAPATEAPKQEAKVEPTAADRKAALLAALAELDGDEAGEPAEEQAEEPAADAPRRRRRA